MDADRLRFRITVTAPSGEKVPLELTRDGLKNLISQLLHAASSVPMGPNLDRQLILDENPVPSNGFMVTPLEGTTDGAHVSIGIGPIDLQFSVLLSDLLATLGQLKEQTEPDPTSPHRPN